MIRDSLRKTIATATFATLSGCVIFQPSSTLAQGYGAQEGTIDVGQEIAGVQQSLRATNARLQQLETSVASINTKLGSGSSQQVSYKGNSYSGGSSSQNAPVAASGQVHHVQRGETLSSISRQYSVGIDRLVKANQLMDPHRLKINQAIIIPGAGSSGGSQSNNTPAKSSAPSYSAPSSSSGTYSVRSGDTLSSIARKNGTSIASLMNANRLTNPDTLKIGQTLNLPGASNSSAPSSPSPSYKNESSSPSAHYDDEPVVSGDVDEAPKGYGYYQIVQGDTLYSIGQDFSITTSELKKLNKLSRDEVVPGQYILVPVDDESLYES